MRFVSLGFAASLTMARAMSRSLGTLEGFLVDRVPEDYFNWDDSEYVIRNVPLPLVGIPIIDSNFEPLRWILAPALDLVPPSSVLNVSNELSAIGCRSVVPSTVSMIACPADNFLFRDLILNRVLELQRLFRVRTIVIVMYNEVASDVGTSRLLKTACGKDTVQRMRFTEIAQYNIYGCNSLLS